MKRKILFVAGLSLFSFSFSYGFLDEIRTFFSAYVKCPSSVASIIPTSSFASCAATRLIDCSGDPVIILELGAGTGPITKEIIKKIRPQDRLDLVEINPELCEILQKKFGSYKNVHIYCVSVIDWQPDYKYDFVISALPHNTFSIDLVEGVLEKYKSLTKNGGMLSYIEYVFFAGLKKIFLFGEKKKLFLEKFSAITDFRKQFEIDSDTVFLNIPPATVYHLNINRP